MRVSADKFDSLITYLILISVLALLEMIIGFARSNVHIIRDVMMSGLMIASMVFSIKMSNLSMMRANG